MKNLASLLYLLTICTLAACRKEQEPAPVPCADVVTDMALLVPAWTWTSDHYSSIYPAVFGQQVIFSQRVNGDKTEFLGFDGVSGQLLWQSTVPAFLYDKYYRQIDSKLYFAGNSRTTLLSFDLATQQLETLWTLPAPGFLLLQFVVQKGFAVCSAAHYMPEIDSVEFSAHLINFQNGQSREILRFRTRDAVQDGILDPQVTITPSGDTIFCFVTGEYGPAFNFYTRFVSLNISTGVRIESDALRTAYAGEQGNLVVEGSRAWFLADTKLQCIDVGTGAVLWQIDNSYFDNSRLLLRQGKALVLNYYGPVIAVDANTGSALWTQYRNGYNGELSGSFLRDGQLFLVKDSRLRSLDFETGCITGDHGLASHLEGGVQNMLPAPDGQRIYFSNYDDLDHLNFLAAPLPK